MRFSLINTKCKKKDWISENVKCESWNELSVIKMYIAIAKPMEMLRWNAENPQQLVVSKDVSVKNSTNVKKV